EVYWLGVDAAFGWSDPASHFAAFEDAVHQTVHEGAVVRSGKPFVLARDEFFMRNGRAFGIGWHVGPAAHRAAETRARQFHAMRMAGLFQVAVPARQTFFTIADISFTHHFIDGVAHRNLFRAKAAPSIWQLERVGRIRFQMIFVFDF